ncbi:hypothetical protein [Pontibacter mangrovi]|uniref:hypothetical protein n=1 Tax=Pontibacter mangrovi TaxID=2589816 RepID=UPI0015E36388|nr:hypothetical protein [Pontibacter mangrovi]
MFTREEYFAILTDSLDYCIMTSHVHLIYKANNTSILLKELKTYTSKQQTSSYPLQRGSFILKTDSIITVIL